MTKEQLLALVEQKFKSQGNQVDLSSALGVVVEEILGITDGIGDLADLDTDHKSDLVAAINEVADAIETTELVISMSQTNAERKVIYDLCLAHPQLTKNLVLVNGDDNLFYKVNGYGFVEDILHFNAIFPDTDGVRIAKLTLASNGSLAAL